MNPVIFYAGVLAFAAGFMAVAAGVHVFLDWLEDRPSPLARGLRALRSLSEEER